jgi:hypothetical protein
MDVLCNRVPIERLTNRGWFALSLLFSLTQPEGFVARNAYYSTMDVASNACTAANSAAYSWFDSRSYFPSVYDR